MIGDVVLQRAGLPVFCQRGARRKLSGFAQPSRANQAAFETAVDEVADSARRLIASLTTQQPPRDREVEAERARERARRRFA